MVAEFHDQRKVEIPSDVNNLCIIEEFVQNVIDDFKIHHNHHPNILIAITEAVCNAINHGNKNDTNKSIAIACQIQPRKLMFVVSDEGAGFNPHSIPNPITEDRICLENGRGVFIMKELADEVVYKNNGNTVEILFNLS